jgi:hypothetical protein
VEPEQQIKTSLNREKFISLAEKQTNIALKATVIIGNLSNTSNYSYTDEDVRKIKRALINQITTMFIRFGGHSSGNSGFSLI